jgi:hypothetical protein
LSRDFLLDRARQGHPKFSLGLFDHFTPREQDLEFSHHASELGAEEVRRRLENPQLLRSRSLRLLFTP